MLQKAHRYWYLFLKTAIEYRYFLQHTGTDAAITIGL
jgi:hypothetical protein